MVRLFTVMALLVLLSFSAMLFTGWLPFHVLTVALGAATLALFWFLRRSLPPSSGTLHIAGLREPVEIYRDDRGIPHIYARNQHDLYLAQGYVTAQDRFWQMEISRRAAAGRLAELLGEEYLERDRHLRTVGIRRAAEASLALYSPETMSHLEAYAAGVNAFLAQKRLPPEFSLLRLAPEPWRPVDSLAVVKLLAYELSNNWAEQLFRIELAQAVGPEKAAALYGESPDPALGLDSLPDGLTGLFHLAVRSLGTIAGTNAWVISGERTASGHPLLASDLHAAPRAPAAWYQTHLVGPDRLDVTGVAYPGVPGILFGHTRDYAWSLSHLGAITQDLVLERPNPKALDQFAYQDGWEPARRIVERIAVRGRPTVTHEILITRHGPILARGDRVALALRSVALQPSAEIEHILQLNRTRTFDEFRRAARRLQSPALAILFAGRNGTIARLVVGSIPVRREGVAQGWTGEDEWDAFIPVDELPESVNPPEGFLVAANQDLTPPEYPYGLCSPWAPPYRAQRLADRLRTAIAWSQEHAAQVLLDVISPHARGLVKLLLRSLHDGLRQGPTQESLNDLEKRALLLITGWDGDERTDSPAALLWQQWHLFLLEETLRPQMGLDLFHAFVMTRSAVPVVDRLLAQVAAGEASPWLELQGEQGLPRIALRSFRRAVAFVAAKYGPNPDRWRWGKEHNVRFRHPLSRRLKWLAPFLDLGPYPVPGSDTTVYHNSNSILEPFGVSHVAAYRRVVDLGLPEEAADVSAPGVSGHPLSPNFRDQLAIWLKDGYAPQHMRHPEIRRFPRLLLTPRKAE